jgi:hypothetical protein
MDLDAADRTPSPLVRVVRTIGFLNLFIGFVLFMFGLRFLNLFGPSLAQNRPFQLEPGDVQNLYGQLRRDLIHSLEVQELATKDPARKARYEQRRRALAARPQPEVERRLNLGAINRDLLWLCWYIWVDVVTGPILNLLMLAAGIGLTQMKSWARRLGLWVATLKIVRLVALTVLLMIFVIPHTSRVFHAISRSDLGEMLIASLNNTQALRTGLDQPATPLTRENFVTVQNIVALFFMAAGLIYPAIALAVLTRPGVKTACLLADEAETDDPQPVSW